ncbi:hypothetical protein TNIN_161621 [Trichonephila inaurata madagascariensis]|uniref:Uncharacterized protein n=1 Tax=Trichonephila inaurata madagascariensis TaxID=2747483 RepID=A0A8X6WX42_9ARAC|nr:hypothetical protein TNIN_161621 [Trichonephila inaurata madagascariensis]
MKFIFPEPFLQPNGHGPELEALVLYVSVTICLLVCAKALCCLTLSVIVVKLISLNNSVYGINKDACVTRRKLGNYNSIFLDPVFSMPRLVVCPTTCFLPPCWNQ